MEKLLTQMSLQEHIVPKYVPQERKKGKYLEKTCVNICVGLIRVGATGTLAMRSEVTLGLTLLFPTKIDCL